MHVMQTMVVPNGTPFVVPSCTKCAFLAESRGCGFEARRLVGRYDMTSTPRAFKYVSEGVESLKTLVEGRPCGKSTSSRPGVCSSCRIACQVCL